MIRLDDRHVQVEQGDTLSAIGASLGVDWRLLATANAVPDPNVIRPGQVLHVPAAAPEVVPDPEPDPDPDPEPEPEPTPGDMRDIHVLRIAGVNAKPGNDPTSAIHDLRRQATWLGRPLLRWSHIGGAWDPATNPKSGAVSPSSRTDIWHPDRSPFTRLCESAVAADRTPADISLECSFPLGLRGLSPSPKTGVQSTIKRVREQLWEVADGTHRLTNGRPFEGTIGGDEVNTYFEAVAEWRGTMHRRYGVWIPVVVRCPWEWGGFSVFPWSPGGWVHYDRPVLTGDGVVTASGMPILTEHQTRYHTENAVAPFTAAARRIWPIITSYGLGLSWCMDKRLLDVFADTEAPVDGVQLAGRCIVDVMHDLLDDTFTADPVLQVDAETSPNTVGSDWYWKDQHAGWDHFNIEMGSHMEAGDYWHARRLDVKAWHGEVGIGSGREDETGDTPVDTTAPLEHFRRVFDANADVLEGVAWFVPAKGGHDLLSSAHPQRRAFMHDWLAADGAPPASSALYRWE